MTDPTNRPDGGASDDDVTDEELQVLGGGARPTDQGVAFVIMDEEETTSGRIDSGQE